MNAMCVSRPNYLRLSIIWFKMKTPSIHDRPTPKPPCSFRRRPSEISASHLPMTPLHSPEALFNKPITLQFPQSLLSPLLKTDITPVPNQSTGIPQPIQHLLNRFRLSSCETHPPYFQVQD